MGAEAIQDKELENVGIEIKGRTTDGDRMLVITNDQLPSYINLVKDKLTHGFWNEIVGEKDIIFLFGVLFFLVIVFSSFFKFSGEVVSIMLMLDCRAKHRMEMK